MPAIHKLNPDSLSFRNEKIEKTSQELNFKFHDLLDLFEGKNEKSLWNNYGDPHPNDYAHMLMGDEIYNYLNK